MEIPVAMLLKIVAILLAIAMAGGFSWVAKRTSRNARVRGVLKGVAIIYGATVIALILLPADFAIVGSCVASIFSMLFIAIMAVIQTVTGN